MGTRETSVWMAWYGVFSLVAIAATRVTSISALIFQLDFLSKNDFGLVFFLFFLTYMANSAVASLFSVFLRSTSAPLPLHVHDVDTMSTWRIRCA